LTYSEAIANYREALSLKADYVEAHNNLGFALKALGKLDSAVASYRKALLLKPDYVEAHNNLGVALREQGKLDAAAASHQTAISIKPDCPEAHNSMGVVLEKQGRLEEAITSFRRAIAIKPDYLEALNNLGIALQAQGKPDEAAATYHQALSLKGDISETQYNLGVVFQGQGKLDEAIDCFRKALEAAPALSAAHVKLAKVLVTQGKLPEAYLHYRKALESSPTQAVANIELCKLLDRIVPPWHVPMMNDKMRNEAYVAAMKGAIKSGSEVLEIGTGSGLLAMLAAQLGAKKVTTCEAEPLIAAAAQRIIADNRLDKAIKVISKKSLDVSVGVDLDNAADILVTEIFSNELLAENCLPSIEDAKRRLLKPGARVIPAGGSIMIALFGGGDIGGNFHVGSCCGFDVRHFNSIIARKQIVARNDLNIDLFTDDIEAFRFDFQSGSYFPEETKTLRMKINTSGVCYGVIQWIRLNMDDETAFENHPSVKSSASGWQYCVYVFPESLKVSQNQVVLISAVHNRFYPWFSLDGIEAPVDQDVA